MKQRKLVIGLLIMLAVAVSGFTFAFWSNIDVGDDTESTSVIIGEGRQATFAAVNLNNQGTGTLVPSGESGNSLGANPVESLTFTFEVAWTDNAYPEGSADLTVTVDNISNATAETYLVFSVQNEPLSITEGAAAMTVTIIVTLNAPSQADYANIINSTVTFDVTFALSNLTAA